MDFTEKLNSAVSRNNSLLCVGLDPDPELFPDAESILDFNRAIIDATLRPGMCLQTKLRFLRSMRSTGLYRSERDSRLYTRRYTCNRRC